MLYLAWRQRFGKASPRTDLTNRRQEATKPFFKEIPPPKVASRNLLWNFLHRTTDSSSTGLRPPLQQPAGSPTTSQQGTIQQTTVTPINKLPCIPHKSMPSEAPRCIRHRSALHQPSQRAAQAHAAHCLSRSGKMGTDKKHIISPQHCAATCHIRTPTAKEASRGLPDMPLPHIKTEGQPHG